MNEISVRYKNAIMLMMMVLIFILLTVIAWIATRLIFPGPPPISWVGTPPLVSDTVCPGDRIEYPLPILARQTGTVRIVWTYRRADSHPDVVDVINSDLGRELQERYHMPIHGDSVIVRTLGDAPAVIIPNKGITVDLDFGFVVPVLPAGPYERVLSVSMQSRASREQIQIQSFVIGENCTAAERTDEE